MTIGCSQTGRTTEVLIGQTCGVKWQSGIRASAVDCEAAVVGRCPPDGIEISEDIISQLRAQVVNEEALGPNSTYGTFVNGRRTEECVLRDVDRIGIHGEVPVSQGTWEDRR